MCEETREEKLRCDPEETPEVEDVDDEEDEE